MTATFNLKALFAATAATAVVLGSLAAGLGSISPADASATALASATRQTTLPTVTVIGRRVDLAPVTVTARRLDLPSVTVVAHRITLQPVTVVGHKVPADTLMAGVQTALAL
jgi:hypothetical protein